MIGTIVLLHRHQVFLLLRVLAGPTKVAAAESPRSRLRNSCEQTVVGKCQAVGCS